MGTSVSRGYRLAPGQTTTRAHTAAGLHIQIADAPLPGVEAVALIGQGRGVIMLLPPDVAGTARESAAVAWAVERARAGQPGWHVRLTAPMPR